VHVMNFMSVVFSLLIYLSFNVQISQLYKSDGIATTDAFIRDCSSTKRGFKTLFRTPRLFETLFFLNDALFLFVWKILLVPLWCSLLQLYSVSSLYFKCHYFTRGCRYFHSKLFCHVTADR
jgi:hypothetical protein